VNLPEVPLPPFAPTPVALLAPPAAIGFGGPAPPSPPIWPTADPAKAVATPTIRHAASANRAVTLLSTLIVLASPTEPLAFAPRLTVVRLPIALVKGLGGLLSQVIAVPLAVQLAHAARGMAAGRQARTSAEPRRHASTRRAHDRHVSGSRPRRSSNLLQLWVYLLFENCASKLALICVNY
jgi:hypothetical protein